PCLTYHYRSRAPAMWNGAFRGALAALAAVAIFAGAPAAQSSAPVTAPPITDLLDAYARGDSDAAARAISAIDRLDRSFDEIRLAAPQWIHKGGGSAERRRLIAATAALEIARNRSNASWRIR